MKRPDRSNWKLFTVYFRCMNRPPLKHRNEAIFVCTLTIESHEKAAKRIIEAFRLTLNDIIQIDMGFIGKEKADLVCKQLNVKDKL